MYQQSSPSRSGKTLAWSLVVLAVVTIAVVLLALRKFNKDTDDMSGGSSLADTKSLQQGQQDEKSLPSDPMPTAQASLSSVNGFIGEVIERNGDENSGGKWIRISVSDQSEGAEAGKMMQYRFFLSNKDTEGTANVKSGSMATVFFVGSPSETDYVQASSVEVK